MTDDIPIDQIDYNDVSIQTIVDGRDDQLTTTAAAARARAFAARLERTIATLDTSQYEAVEVITPRQSIGLGSPELSPTVQGQPVIRRVEQGEPYAEELLEGAGKRVKIERYSADEIEEMRTYAQEARDREDLAPLERFVDRQLDAVDDEDVTAVAKRILESLRQHGDGFDDGGDVDA